MGEFSKYPNPLEDSMKKPLSKAISLSALILTILLLLAAFAPGLVAQSQEENKDEGQYLLMMESLFRYIQDQYVDEVDAQTLYEGAIKGMFESLDDPYSVYLTASDMEDFADTTEGEFGGVGLYISKSASILFNEDTNADSMKETFRTRYAPFVEVISPIEGTPAYRAGVSAGDFIIAIDDESTESLTMDDVLAKLRGTPGTDVTMTIARRGNIIFDVPVTRAIIEVPVLRSAMMPDGIGYIRIIKWTPFTQERITEALDEFQRDNRFKALILDVRGNPGGLLSSVIDVCDLFLNRGPIVSTRSRIESENEVFYAKRRTSLPLEFPIMVMIDEGSASASEIMAGALKDTDRALLVGSTTYGKGSVQQIRAFGEGGFKMTTSRYYTPNGINIDKVGIDPHVTIEEEEFSENSLEDLQVLYEENRIPFFVENNPNPGASAIGTFIQGLRSEDIDLDQKILERMIRQEVNRTLNDPPIFDLEYDSALMKAVDLIEEGSGPEDFR